MRWAESPSIRKKHHVLYNTVRWKRVRLQVLGQQPLCVECLKEDKLTPTVEVEHIVSLTDDWSLRLTLKIFKRYVLTITQKKRHEKEIDTIPNSSPSDGDLWLDSGTSTLKFRIGGATKTITWN